jgi:hypothetical protein
MLADGRLHLSAVCLLAPHLTEENRASLLEAAVHRSKRRIELLLAERFPRPDVPQSIRKLPMPQPRPPPAMAVPPPAPNPIAAPPPEPSKPATPAAALAAAAPAPPPRPAVVAPLALAEARTNRRDRDARTLPPGAARTPGLFDAMELRS